MRPRFSSAAFEFGDLFRREFVVEFFTELLEDFALFFQRKLVQLLQELGRAHGGNLLPPNPQASDKPASGSFRVPHSAFRIAMIPRELLKKIRQIEIRTNRLVTESLAGAYHSVFKGQGMNFDEVREYQPGDDVRSIDWNVTARMNHPFIKKFVEERELTVMLLVDLSSSGLFGSAGQSKRELAAEIASVLAFSAIRNADKVGLILFTDTVEKFIPPRKGRRHVLRVIREILCFEPQGRGTDLTAALEFLTRVTPHRSISVVISDFLGHSIPSRVTFPPVSLLQTSQTALRQAHRKHDVVAVQITDRFEDELPALGRVVLEDAETGEVVEVNTADAGLRRRFTERRVTAVREATRVFNSLRIDTIQLRTDQPYGTELAHFFEKREKRRRRG